MGEINNLFILPITREDSKRKSSRLKADLFEVKIALGLARKYHIKPRINLLERELEKLKKQLARFSDRELRVNEQVIRATILIPKIVHEMERFIKVHGKVVDIHWIGRDWQETSSLSDVDVVFKLGHEVGISLKSTKVGKGTQKNPGYRSFKKYLSLNVDDELESMWISVRKDLKAQGKNLTLLADRSRITIRKNKYRFPIIQTIGNKHGAQVQKLAVARSVKLFNRLNPRAKLEYLEYLLGINEIKPLLNASVEGNKAHLYWNRALKDITERNLSARTDSDKGYTIMTGGDPVLRIQVNFTNGIGLSPLCGRVFLIKKIAG